MTKTVVFDGGPLDGQVMAIYDYQKDYTVYEPNMESDKFGKVEMTEHHYREDPKVEGHFIYQGKSPIELPTDKTSVARDGASSN